MMIYIIIKLNILMIKELISILTINKIMNINYEKEFEQNFNKFHKIIIITINKNINKNNYLSKYNNIINNY